MRKYVGKEELSWKVGGLLTNGMWGTGGRLVSPTLDQRKGMQRSQRSQRLDQEALCHRQRHDLVADQG